MKLPILPLLVASLVSLAICPSAEAAKKGKKGKKGEAASARVLSRFDRDQSGRIDGEEVTHVQALFGSLAALDADKDGTLSESELAGAKVTAGKRGKKKSK